MTKRIKKIGEKTLYNLDNKKPLSKWLREEVKNSSQNLIEVPYLKSFNATKEIENKKPITCKVLKNYIGYFMNDSNNVYQSVQNVAIFTSGSCLGFSIIPENFEKVCAAFTARKSIKDNWIIHHNEYMVPNHD